MHLIKGHQGLSEEEGRGRSRSWRSSTIGGGGGGGGSSRGRGEGGGGGPHVLAVGGFSRLHLRQWLSLVRVVHGTISVIRK